MTKDLTIHDLVNHDNIVTVLPDATLGLIEQHVKRGYEADLASNSEWLKQIETAMKLAAQTSEIKTYPFDKASNVKYPVITTAAIQFAANAYPAIVDNSIIIM